MLYDMALLRSFVAVCDTGSFTKAAGEVNLTQSAVSLHIKRLEDEVGSRLIVRNVRGLRLTEHGEVLQSYARRILALYKEAERRLGRDAGGLIRIGVPEYFDLHTLSSLGQFTARHPAVRMHVELGIWPDILALVDEGEVDLAIVSCEIREGDGIPLCASGVSGQAGGRSSLASTNLRRLPSIRPSAAGDSSHLRSSTRSGAPGSSSSRAPEPPGFWPL